MKEVLTKSFWEGVKKTFYEALEDPPPADTALQTPAKDDLSASSTPEKPSSPSGTDLARSYPATFQKQVVPGCA